MTVRIYRSTDTGAPVLSGTAGTLTTLLDAVLVGSGGIAYGSKASSGWTIAFTATNNRIYQQGSGSNGFVLYIDDTAPHVTALGREARLIGAESASSISVLTNRFPTVAQGTYVLARKSASTDTIARPWIIAADSRTFYMFTLTGDTANAYLGWMFGEFYSYKTSDGYRTMICARDTENSGTITVDKLDFIGLVSAIQVGKFITRDASSNVGAVTAGNCGKIEATTALTPFPTVGVVRMPNTSDHLVYIAPLRVSHTVGGNTIRGRMRGLWHFCHQLTACSDGDTFSGQQGLAGKSFMIIKQSGNAGVYCLETSDTWDSN